jgi:hypothetical protein
VNEQEATVALDILEECVTVADQELARPSAAGAKI